MLRADNKVKTKYIDQIKDLNIKLQIELERYRSAASHHVSFKMPPESDVSLKKRNFRELRIILS